MSVHRKYISLQFVLCVCHFLLISEVVIENRGLKLPINIKKKSSFDYSICWGTFLLNKCLANTLY